VTALSDKSLVPKYQQLKAILKRDINRRRLRPGQLLPSENELRSRYDVSSTTVRRALNDLATEGVVVRHQGKGTFVASNRVQRSLRKLYSFTDNMRDMGLVPSTEVISVSLARAPRDIAHALGLRPRDRLFVLERLRFGNDTPMLYETRYLPARLFPGLDKQNLSGSLYEIITDVYSVRLKRATQSIRIAHANEKVAQLLDVPPYGPVFFVTGVTYSTDNVPVEYEHSYYRGDKYQFVIDVGANTHNSHESERKNNATRQ